jgi:hypothetical protein
MLCSRVLRTSVPRQGLMAMKVNGALARELMTERPGDD